MAKSERHEQGKKIVPLALQASFRRENNLSKDVLLPLIGSRFVSNGVAATGALDMSKAKRAQVHASNHQVV